MKIERRFFPTSLHIEQRGNGEPVIRGDAAVFDSLSENLGGFRERIKPGAFAKSLAKNPDTRALFNHNPDYILGRTTAGTLEISEGPTGLAYIIHPPDTQVARDLMESMRRGDINQSSFAFRVPKGGDRWFTENGQQIRELLEVDIHNGDISPVTYPAYLGTSATTRSLWPDGVPDSLRQHLASSGGSGPAPKELHAFEAWWQEKIVAERERKIQAEQEAKRREIDAQLAMSVEQLREKRRMEKFAANERWAKAEYRRREEERRKEIEGRCKPHGRFCCLTCHPRPWAVDIVS